MTTNVQGTFQAYFMLFSWPLFGIAFFLKFPAQLACAVTLIGGFMFLPAGLEVHFSGLPPFDKDLSASLAAIIGCLVVKPRLILRGSNRERRYLILSLIIIVGYFFTVQTNTDPIKVGPSFLPALTFHDFLSMTIRFLLHWWPAFLLGRRLFNRAEHLEVLCKVLTVGGLIYSLFILVELRMSPVFNSWVYGVGGSTASLLQNFRDGGYRPMVFMGHGLRVALFMLICLLAATGLARARIRLFGISTRAVAVYLALILSVMHSSGVLINAVVLVPSLIWMRARSQARLAFTLASIVLFYPLLRFLDIVPIDSIVSFFNALLGPERAESLLFRFRNEAELLAKAVQRPWFGWGGYLRQMIFFESGREKSVIDGEWISILGYSGVVGFIGYFGSALLPIFVFARKRLRQMTLGRNTILASTVLLISAASVFDLLPNAGLSPHVIMMFGALAGVQVDRPASV